jgi:predicted extracellular nuclease
MRRFRFLFLPLLACVFLAVPAANGAGSSVVISQVFAGGGNSGAPYTNDFVELLNRGASAVDVSSWSIQYASASSTSWSTTALSGSIQPGHYYLVQLASGANGVALPTPDATGTTNMASTGGKVALVDGTTALTCGATAGSCSANPDVQDLIGYGSATDYEGGTAAPALSNTTAAVRADGGCTDTDSSSADFATASPSPRNSASAAATCGSSPPAGPTASAAASVDVDVQQVLSMSLERPTISFGTTVSGATPSPISEHVTVVSNDTAGYSLAVHRSSFSPSDLPLGLALPDTAVVPIPIAPASDLLIGGTTAPSAGGGDVWPTAIGFSAPLPVTTPGHYTATVTFTVIGK